VVHFNITAHPTAQWTAQQVVEAFPWDKAPRSLLRDRDRLDGAAFRRRVHHRGIAEVVMAPRSPWQHPSVERLIGSLRRECLDHMLILQEPQLRSILTSDFGDYHVWRTPLSLAMDCPKPRHVQGPQCGEGIAMPAVGGLHHHDQRRAT
jgi:putative transposase